MEAFFSTQKHYFCFTVWTGKGVWFLMAVLLCPINWMFEALKWKQASRQLGGLGFVQSLKAVITGQALNLVFPASMGHLAGRILSLNQPFSQKIHAAGLVFLCQAMQMACTVLAFVLAVFFLGYRFPLSMEFVGQVCLGGSLLALAVGTWVYMRRVHWLQACWDKLKMIRVADARDIFCLSVFRYLTFLTQYILVFYFLGVQHAWIELASAIAMVFMAKSLMPSINFMSDLGVREFAALLFLPTIGLSEEIVISASLWVWLINILLPSLIGALWLWKLKLNQLFCY